MFNFSFDYYGLRAQTIENVFPNCLPCNCFSTKKQIYKIPRYKVKLIYGEVISPLDPNAETKIIKRIGVACGCCNTYKVFNVEKFNISLKKLPWKRTIKR